MNSRRKNTMQNFRTPAEYNRGASRIQVRPQNKDPGPSCLQGTFKAAGA